MKKYLIDSLFVFFEVSGVATYEALPGDKVRGGILGLFLFVRFGFVDQCTEGLFWHFIDY